MKFAFELDGISYWEFPDKNIAPCHRMFAAMDFYNEFNMRCTREYLIAHCEAFREKLNGQGGVVDLISVSQLYVQLQERLQWIFEPETAYKYASVVFMDQSESPYAYDHKYNQEKIRRWKQHAPEDFFLSMPVKKLFPLLDLSKDDFQDYLKVLRKIDQKHLETIFTMLSSNQRTKGWYSTLESLRQEG